MRDITMSGYLIPEIWCDLCSDRNVAEDQGTLEEHRSYLIDECGWGYKRPTNEKEQEAAEKANDIWSYIDVCPDCQKGAS